MDIPQFIDLTDHSILEGDKINLDGMKETILERRKKWKMNIQTMA